MNVIWRTLLVLAAARRRRRRGGTLPITAVGRIRIRTLPTDLDIIGHMNNGRYLSLFDLGRWDLMVRTGLFDILKNRGWYPVVAAETISFRRSLELWQAFDVETRMIGHDGKSIYLEHRAVVGGEIYTRAVVRARILRRSGGPVPHDEILEALGHDGELPEIDAWMKEWAAASALPSTKDPAPSVWG